MQHSVPKWNDYHLNLTISLYKVYHDVLDKFLLICLKDITRCPALGPRYLDMLRCSKALQMGARFWLACMTTVQVY